MLSPILAGLLLAPVSPAVPDDAPFRFAPPLGFQDDQRWTWTFTIPPDLSYGGAEEDPPAATPVNTVHVLVDRARARVVQRDAGGPVVLEWSTVPISETVDGERLMVPADLPPLRLRETRAADGRLAERDEHPIDGLWGLRYARLWALPLPGAGAPLAADREWTVRETSDDLAVPALEGRFRVAGEAPTPAGRPGWRITWTRRESGEPGGEAALDASGTTWIDARTGWVWRIEAVVESARVPSAEDQPPGRLAFVAAPWSAGAESGR